MNIKHLEKGFLESKESYVCLRLVKTDFTQSDLKLKEYIYLKGLYIDRFDVEKNQKEKFMRIVITLVNSVVTQKRVFFATSIRGINRLVKLDTNWENRIPLHSREYSIFKKWCYNYGFMKLVKKGDQGSVWLFELTESMVLDYIIVNPKQQKEEALLFQSEYVIKRKGKKQIEIEPTEKKEHKHTVKNTPQEDRAEDLAAADTESMLAQMKAERIKKKAENGIISIDLNNKPTCELQPDGSYIATDYLEQLRK